MVFDDTYAKDLAKKAPKPDALAAMGDGPAEGSDEEEASESPEDEAGEDAAEESAISDLADAFGVKVKDMAKAKSALADFVRYCGGK